MSQTHAVIWLDEDQAQIVHFDRRADEHRRIERGGTGRYDWFDTLSRAIADAEAILVAGHGAAPADFAAWVQRVSPAQRARIFDVQRLQRLTDRDLVTHARRYFERIDSPHHPDAQDLLPA